MATHGKRSIPLRSPLDKGGADAAVHSGADSTTGPSAVTAMVFSK
jgi:hypothetical protein